MKNLVEQALDTENWDPLEDWISEHCSFSFQYGARAGVAFDTAVFEAILLWLRDERFLKSSGSHNLLRVPEYEWSTITPDQRIRLRDALLSGFPRSGDPMSWFLTCELLGEYYADERALQDLRGLLNTQSEAARSLVAMGLGLLARNARQAQVAEGACAELSGLTSDASPLVRDEAARALGQIEALRTQE